MAFCCKILADSVNPVGCRLVTFEVTYPRFIHSELLTHRMFSRNSASSRAIPVEKMIARIMDEPVMPIDWGKNQKGMQAGEEIPTEDRITANSVWLKARHQAVDSARQLMNLGVHKQIANRLVEPFMWITVIVSTTSFEHFRRLRVSPFAEPHFQKIAGMMADAYDSNTPSHLSPGRWHLPLIGFEGDGELTEADAIKVSAARCARVSYLTHDGRRDIQADIDLHDRLSSSGHWSPFEHPAKSVASSSRFGNFDGFVQYRKTFQDEFVPDSQPDRFRSE